MEKHSWLWEVIQDLSIYAARSGLLGFLEKMQVSQVALISELGRPFVLRSVPISDQTVCAKESVTTEKPTQEKVSQVCKPNEGSAKAIGGNILQHEWILTVFVDIAEYAMLNRLHAVLEVLASAIPTLQQEIGRQPKLLELATMLESQQLLRHRPELLPYAWIGFRVI